jgi:flagellar basal-body rod modification protein FlgD
MEIAATLNAGNTAGTQVVGQNLDGITGNDFMNILIKQLQLQDPFEPMGNQEMVQQISTIRELEMNTRLSNRLEQITEQQRFGSAASLIGRHVKGAVTDSEGTRFEIDGIVTGIRFTPQGEAMLELDTGETLPLKGLEQVKDAELV